MGCAGQMTGGPTSRPQSPVLPAVPSAQRCSWTTGRAGDGSGAGRTTTRAQKRRHLSRPAQTGAHAPHVRGQGARQAGRQTRLRQAQARPGHLPQVHQVSAAKCQKLRRAQAQGLLHALPQLNGRAGQEALHTSVRRHVDAAVRLRCTRVSGPLSMRAHVQARQLCDGVPGPGAPGLQPSTSTAHAVPALNANGQHGRIQCAAGACQVRACTSCLPGGK